MIVDPVATFDNKCAALKDLVDAIAHDFDTLLTQNLDQTISLQRRITEQHVVRLVDKQEPRRVAYKYLWRQAGHRPKFGN